MKVRTVFLDRDGVLNADRPDYLLRLEDVLIPDDVPGALKDLTDAGKRLIVVSNQAGIGKGLLSRDHADKIFDKVILGAEAQGGKIMDRYYCPHTNEDECSCRKPEVGMFMQAVKDHGVRLEYAVFVGDGFGDARAAKKLNIPFYLLSRGWGPETKRKCDKANIPYIYVKDLQEAVNRILESEDDKI